MVTVSLMINSVDYSSSVLDLKVSQSVSNYSKKFEAILKDPNGTIYSAIAYGHDVQISLNGTVLFRGLIELRELKRNGELKIAGRDYFLRFTERFVTKTYANQTASQIISDLISSYFSGELTSTNVQSTTTQYTRTYKGTMIADIIKEMATLEDYIVFVDENKDVNFRPKDYVDYGKHYTNEILDHRFPEVGSKVRNSILVIYGSNLDQGIRREDSASIAQYGKKEHRIISSTITSEDQAIQKAEFELRKYANPLILGEVLLKLDESLEAGQVIWLTINELGYSDEQFLILEAEHKILPPSTKLKVAQVSRETSEVLEEMIRKMRETDEQRVSSEAIIATYEIQEAEILAKVYCTVERRTISGALVGEFTVGKKRVGQLSGSWTTIFSAQDSILANQGIEDMVRIWAQLPTVPNKLDSASANIAVGAGSTTAKITDSGLASETSRLAVDAGTPRKPDSNPDGKILWTATFGDAELPAATLREFGILNANSGGDLFSRYVHSSNVSKAQDEEIRVTFQLELSNSKQMTTNGLNLLRDILAGFSTDYLDSSNAAIEISGSATYRELTNSGYPRSPSTLFDSVEFQIRVTNPADIATGTTITSISLYNKTSGGIQVTNTTVATITAISGEDNVFRQKIKVKRS